MNTKREMSPNEGFRELRRKLPSLDRAYRRQRFAQWTVRVLLIVGTATVVWAAAAAIVTSRRRQAPPISPVSVRSDLPLDPTAVNPTKPPPNAEAAPDEIAHTELPAGGSHR
jgi:hypothetical protein